MKRLTLFLIIVFLLSVQGLRLMVNTSLNATTADRPLVQSAPLPKYALFRGEIAYKTLVINEAKAHGIEPALLMGLIAQESWWNVYATSPSGARGLGQLMRDTAFYACRDLFTSDDVNVLYNPARNVKCSARYFKQQMMNCGGWESCALSSYNAGPGATARNGGFPPTAQAKEYVPKVLYYKFMYKKAGY